jgi:hypothetical protein
MTTHSGRWSTPCEVSDAALNFKGESFPCPRTEPSRVGTVRGRCLDRLPDERRRRFHDRRHLRHHGGLQIARSPRGERASDFADHLPADATVHARDVVTDVVSAWGEIAAIGDAQVGDKTLVDALEPFATTLQAQFDAGKPLVDAWTTAVEAAEQAAAATANIPARMGRSRVLGEKSIGTPDPGAISLAACTRALIPVVARVPA